jgi:hypothetical protein
MARNDSIKAPTTLSNLDYGEFSMADDLFGKITFWNDKVENDLGDLLKTVLAFARGKKPDDIQKKVRAECDNLYLPITTETAEANYASLLLRPLQIRYPDSSHPGRYLR